MSTLNWLILIISLPGRSGTPRMRVWRSLKGLGAGILRDGVYVLPQSTATESALRDQAEEVCACGGTAYLLKYPLGEVEQANQFLRLFDRSADYDQWTERAALLQNRLRTLQEAQARREGAQLRREFETIAATDYFADKSQDRAATALAAIEATINTLFSPDEPTPGSGEIERCSRSDFQGQCWATRRNLWVDRVASAWLIRRFIDAKARFLWLKQPSDCPPTAIGFDFDGATFSHVGSCVTFEVLLQSFALSEDPALYKLGALVHYLDIGGVPVPEAAGFVAMVAGVKTQCADDDTLLDEVSSLLDHLYCAFTTEAQTGPEA